MSENASRIAATPNSSRVSFSRNRSIASRICRRWFSEWSIQLHVDIRGRSWERRHRQHCLDACVLVLILKQDVQIVHLRPGDSPLLLHAERGVFEMMNELRT